MRTDRTEIRIAGKGGQGVILSGKILGDAAVHDGRYAVHTSSYGAEARGTAARSDIIISGQSIAFPQVRNCDILIAMSESALEKYLKSLREDGSLIVDPDLVKETATFPGKTFNIPANNTSQRELGSPLYANMVMLGALTKITGVVTEEAMEEAMADYVSSDELSNNLKAFKLGLGL